MTQNQAGDDLRGQPVGERQYRRGETFTVTLPTPTGCCRRPATGGATSRRRAATSLTIAGSLAQVNSDLARSTDNDASTAADTITVNASDSFGNSAAPQSIAVSVTSSSSTAPVLGGGGNTVYWTQGNAPTVVDTGLTVTDSGSTTLTGATVTISSGFLAGDQLNFTNQNGITGSYNAATGVLTLSGASSVANYQTALELGQLQLDELEPECSRRR